MVLHSSIRRRVHEPAAEVFDNKDHRTEMLIKKATEETARQLHHFDRCSKATFETHLLPFPDSEWVPSDRDIDTFGIMGTNEPTEYLMTIPLRKACNKLPNVGSAVEVDLAVDQIFHTAPKFPVGGRELEKLVQDIHGYLSLAECEAYMAELNLQRKIEKRCRGGDNAKEGFRQEEIDDTNEFTRYQDIAASYLFQYNANISNEAIQEMPSASDDLRRWYDALRFASELGGDEFEGGPEDYDRIRKWIRKQEVNSRIPFGNEPWIGYRIKLPRGITANVALFHLKVPRQPYWPGGRVKPPVTLQMPKRQFPTDLQTYFLSVIKKSSQAIRAQISYEIDDKSNRMACSAVQDMKKLEVGSLADIWWEFLTRFEEIPASGYINLLKWFPALQINLENGVFRGGYAKAIEAMTKSRAGKVFITGDLGSGKSFFASLVGRTIMSQPPDPAAAQPLTTEPADDEQDNIDAALQDKIEEEQCNMKIVRYPFWKAARESLQREKIMKKEQEYNRAKSHTGRVAWVAPQNVQVDDAVRRLAAMSPDKTILRIYSYRAEVDNLISAKPEALTAIYARQMNAPARQMVDAYNRSQLHRDKKRNPAADKNSWSESCRRMVQAQPSKFPTLLAAWREYDEIVYKDDKMLYVKDGMMYEEGHDKFVEAAREALKLHLEQADAVCATPVALAMMAKHVSWEPSFVIVDNADQLTETMTTLPVSVYPNVPTMFIGNTQQPGPMVKTSRSSQYKASSTKQRADSLLRRVEAAGYVDFHLPAKRRRQGKKKAVER